jgi:hypothetical protein
MARTGEGGGYGARVVTHTNSPKQEPRSNQVSVGAVSRLGGMMGVGSDHKNLYSSKATTPFGTTPSVPGPGGGRMVMRSGSQSPTPAARPMPAATRKF